MCHQPERPEVKTIGPNLAKMGLDTPFKILAQMWNHAPAIERRMKLGNIRWPLFAKHQNGGPVRVHPLPERERMTGVAGGAGFHQPQTRDEP